MRSDPLGRLISDIYELQSLMFTASLCGGMDSSEAARSIVLSSKACQIAELVWDDVGWDGRSLASLIARAMPRKIEPGTRSGVIIRSSRSYLFRILCEAAGIDAAHPNDLAGLEAAILRVRSRKVAEAGGVILP